MHQLAAFRGENGCAENSVIRGINDDFHQSGGFSAFEGTRDMDHWTSSNFQLVALRASLFSRHPHAAELWIGEHAIRDQPVFRVEIFPFYDVCIDDLKVVVGNMRESGPAFAIAECPDSW